MIIVSVIGFICNLMMGHVLHSSGGGHSHGMGGECPHSKKDDLAEIEEEVEKEEHEHDINLENHDHCHDGEDHDHNHECSSDDSGKKITNVEVDTKNNSNVKKNKNTKAINRDSSNIFEPLLEHDHSKEQVHNHDHDHKKYVTIIIYYLI